MEGNEEIHWTTNIFSLLGSGGSNRVWGRIEGRGVFIRITGGNVKVMGINQAKKKSISRYGNSEREIQGRDRGKVAYYVLGGRERIGNRNWEIGWEVAANYGGGGRDNIRLGVTAQLGRSDEK